MQTHPWRCLPAISVQTGARTGRTKLWRDHVVVTGKAVQLHARSLRYAIPEHNRKEVRSFSVSIGGD